MTKAKKATYEVGYGRPPLHSRFKKGQSGNPNGSRRRSSESLRGNDLLRHEADRLVTVREGDKVVRMPAAQAAVRRMFLAAGQGDRSAMKMVLDILQSIAGTQVESKLPDVISPRDAARRIARVLLLGAVPPEEEV